jgi:hypothetical protein
MRSTGNDGMTSPAAVGVNFDADSLCGGVTHDVLLLLLPPLSERLTWSVKCACQFGAEHRPAAFFIAGIWTPRPCAAPDDMPPECPERGVNLRRGNIRAGDAGMTAGLYSLREGETIMLSIKTSICCVCEAVKTVRAISAAWMKQGFPAFFISAVRTRLRLPPSALCR